MYFVFTFLTLISFISFGSFFHKKKSNLDYWLFASIPIGVYSLTYGLRQGWGVDYNHYWEIFRLGLKTDVAFDAINDLLLFIGLPHPFEFITYSLILGVGMFFMLKDQKSYAQWILPILYCTCFGAVSLIRFYVAVGWIFIAIHYLLNNKWKLFFLFSLITICTHTSLVVIIPVLVFFKYGDLCKNRIFVLTVFSIATFLLDSAVLGSDVMLPVVEFLRQHVDNERLDFYSEHSDVFLSGERLLATTTNESYRIIHTLRMFVTHFIILCWGFKYKDKYRFGSFYYNMAAIGLIFFQATQGYELIERYRAFFYIFISFVLGFIMYENHKNIIGYKHIMGYVLIIFCIINLFFRMFLGQQTLLMFNTYIWD